MEKDRVIRIILAEDHQIVREGLRMLIVNQPDMVIAGEASTGDVVLKLLSNGLEADILITDLNMPVMDGFELLKAIQYAYPKLKSIALSMHDMHGNLQKVLSYGGAGYLIKTIDADELLFAIRQVYLGKNYLCSQTVSTLLQNQTLKTIPQTSLQDLPEFSSRELEVMNLIAKGLTNQEIADQLFLSKRTVEGHRQSLIDKTASRNTAVLVRFAVMHGLVS